uniref:SWIM-type domain-containing protein n=1 Tax=Panagrolaimus sp. ES5 TaxID=591445 RepID=A0AC34F1Q6_9BILA
MAQGLRDDSSAAAYLANQSIDKAFITELEESLTSNNSETLNALIRRHTDKKELQIDELIYILYYIGGLQYNDILRAYYNDGSYEMGKQYKKKYLKGDKFDLPEDELMSLPSMEEFNQYILEQEGPILTGKRNEGVRKALVSTVMDSFNIFQVNDSLYVVEDPIQKRSEAVSFSQKGTNCSCRRKATCLHILSVLKLQGKDLVVNNEVGDAIKDEKRLRNKKQGRLGRKRRQTKIKSEREDSEEELNTDSQPKVTKKDVPSPPSKKILKPIMDEKEVEKNNGITALRLFLCDWVPAFYSTNHRPPQILELATESVWFHDANSPATFSNISTNVYKPTFFEPFPVIPVGKSVFGSTSDDALLLIVKTAVDKVFAVAVGSIFSNNATDECFMHAAMVGRGGDHGKVSVTLFIAEGVVSLKEKLLHLTGYNNDFNDVTFSCPRMRVIRAAPTPINDAYLKNFITTDGNLLQSSKKNVTLWCCCRRCQFTLSEERNNKLQIFNNTSIQCSSCKKWYFWRCAGVDRRIYSKWICWECAQPPLLVRHSSRDNSRFTNSCPADGFLSAAMVFNERFPDVIRKLPKTSSISEIITVALQPANSDIWKYCCQQRCAVFDIKYGVREPWVLPLRFQLLPLLRIFTPELIEEFPMEVEVINGDHRLTYKLGLISFSTPGH